MEITRFQIELCHYFCYILRKVERAKVERATSLNISKCWILLSDIIYQKTQLEHLWIVLCIWYWPSQAQRVSDLCFLRILEFKWTPCGNVFITNWPQISIFLRFSFEYLWLWTMFCFIFISYSPRKLFSQRLFNKTIIQGFRYLTWWTRLVLTAKLTEFNVKAPGAYW